MYDVLPPSLSRPLMKRNDVSRSLLAMQPAYRLHSSTQWRIHSRPPVKNVYYIYGVVRESAVNAKLCRKTKIHKFIPAACMGLFSALFHVQKYVRPGPPTWGVPQTPSWWGGSLHSARCPPRTPPHLLHPQPPFPAVRRPLYPPLPTSIFGHAPCTG